MGGINMRMNNKHEACERKSEEYLYKIGVFAAMNHVTVKTLRFYESKGLLVPAYVDKENGYRYYTMNHMAIIHQITALKQAGFTLDDIAKINSGSDEGVFLLNKKAELLGKIAELTKQLALIDRYLAKKNINLDTPVLVKTIPEVTVAAARERMESYDDLFDMMPRIGELMEKAGCECAVPEYCFTNYLDSVSKDEDVLVEICQSVTEPKKEQDGIYYKKMPEVLAACIFHKGSYADFPKSYETVLKYIEENNLEIAGEIREKYIDGVWNKEDESEWLSEIQIPVRKRGEE